MNIRNHIESANLHWDTLPTHYFEGPYVGNGNNDMNGLYRKGQNGGL